MKSTGIIRTADNLGRIGLPKELRKSFAITSETPLEIFTDDDAIVLRKYRPAGSCDFCGEVTADTVEYRGMHICAACRRAISQL